MRVLSLSFVILLICAAGVSHAAAITPEEAKVQADFSKAYNNPDKTARMTAISMLEGMKHPSSYGIVYKIAASDPDESVRMAALEVLAKEPAHDDSVARMLGQLADGIRNDLEKKAEVITKMAASEFKFPIVSSATDTLMRARYPDEPKLYQGANGQSNIGLINAVKKQRKEYEAMLDALNAVAKTEIAKPTKETPNTMKTWWATNAAKIAADDKALADKYRKEDAEAAKAAAEAKKNAK
jgi:hypothetical protein